MKITAIALAMFISAIAAESPYPRFEAQMTKFGYEWSAHKVTTSDGYILTTFMIPANKDETYRGSILIQHSDTDDGASWIENHDGEKPFHFLLADQGYKVWIGNNRGTEYSQRHTTYDAAGLTAEKYWDFSWFEMQKDVKANIEEILLLTKEEKIYYIGYSQGTTQMISAIAGENDWYAERLHRAVMLAPCFTRYYPAILFEWYYSHSISKFRDDGIYALYGPNWSEDSQKLCEKYDTATCLLYTSDTELKQPISVKAEQHWFQNGILEEFNEFQENWNQGNRISNQIDVSKIIDVPMSFFVGTLDFTCPDGIAYQNIKKMPAYKNKATKTQIINLDFKSHLFFADSTFETQFMDDLLKQLQL